MKPGLQALIQGHDEVAYVWVLRRTPRKWLVSDWDGNEGWITVDDFDVRPDLELCTGGIRKPVFRLIGTGKVAQHFRFERMTGERD
jgi:hypothetical protein